MGFFNLSFDQAKLETIEQRVREGSYFKGTNFFVLLLAILIASIGLNINSIPVIIGAMLISPLLGPIIGIAYFIVRNDLEHLKVSAKSFLHFLLFSICISSLYFFVSPLEGTTPELLNRVNPTIWDALVAFLGGAAGIVAITRKDFNNIFPGVAIATSLMPPLCTMGYGIAHFNMDIMLNAFYLFFLNSFFIALASVLMLHLLHIPEIAKDRTKAKKMHYALALISASLILIPGIHKGSQIIAREIFDVKAQQLLAQLEKQNAVVIAHSRTNKEPFHMTLTVLQDESLKSVDFTSFSQRYGLKVNLIAKEQALNVEQLKEQLLAQVQQSTQIQRQREQESLQWNRLLSLQPNSSPIAYQECFAKVHFLEQQSTLIYPFIQKVFFDCTQMQDPTVFIHVKKGTSTQQIKQVLSSHAFFEQALLGSTGGSIAQSSNGSEPVRIQVLQTAYP